MRIIRHSGDFFGSQNNEIRISGHVRQIERWLSNGPFLAVGVNEINSR